MSFGSNDAVQIEEEKVREFIFNNIILEAAHYVVVNGLSREEAYEHSKSLHTQREDTDNFVVVDDETGQVEYLHSKLVPPVINETMQIKAVANELYSQFEYDL